MSFILAVEGDLDVRGCSSLRCIGPDLRVRHAITIGKKTPIESVCGITVGGSLDLHGSRTLTQLGEGIQIGGELNLEGSSIRSLPRKIRVGAGVINLKSCSALQAVPEDFTAIQRTGAKAVLSWLPASVPWSRLVERCRANPGSLICGSIDFSGCTALRRLPRRMVVTGALTAARCRSLRALPKILLVGNRLDVSGCGALRRTSRVLFVGVSADLRGSRLTRAAWLEFVSAYAAEGDMLVPQRVFRNPQSLTFWDLLAIRSLALRRFAAARMGWSHFLAHAGAYAKVVDRDADPRIGTLYRVKLPRFDGPDQAIALLEVRDGTSPERKYVLRVAPPCRSARQANAWTFGLNAGQYQPVEES